MPPRPPRVGVAAVSKPSRCLRNTRFPCKYEALRASNPSRSFSTTPNHYDEAQTPQESRPRYSYTPERMKAPFSLKSLKPHNEWKVNSDPQILEEVYVRVLGEEGARLLTAEVKFLAVTHKSFDQGRRGFNDRLAFLGKRIVDLQTSLALLSQQGHAAPAPQDAHGRTPFLHPALESLTQLTPESREAATKKSTIANLADKFGMMSVLRWRPRNVCEARHCYAFEI
jgi:large subunit ribosomal protein L15